MKKPSFLLLIVVTILTMIFMTACGGSNSPAEETSASTTSEETVAEQPAAEEPAAEQPAAEEPTSEAAPAENGTTGEQPAAEEPTPEGVALNENGVPVDVPMPEGAYDLRVEANNTRITFKVDGALQDVVTYFQEQLPTLGWTETLGADSAVGSMGTIGRKNGTEDKLSINMSFNPNGNFVTVTMDVIRAP